MPIFNNEIKSAVQFHGEFGVTQTGIDAVIRLIQSRELISKAVLLTYNRNDHFFYFELSELERIIIRPSFSSGYPGEGPAGLACVILLLRNHGIELEEIEVSADIFRRAAECKLTNSDLEIICSNSFVRPWRIIDYTYHVLDSRGGDEKVIRAQYKLTMPFGIIDSRILDLAVKLPELQENAIFEACKRLEVQIAERCAVGKFGTRLIKHAFEGSQSALVWEGCSDSEIEGRSKLFIGAFSTIRNPKAHKIISLSLDQAYQEFLLINYLFKLESEASIRKI